MVRAQPDAESQVIAVGDKGYVGSRNLAKPVRESQLVDDNVTITAPPGAVILDQTSGRMDTAATHIYRICCPSRGKPQTPKNRIAIIF